MERLSGDYIKGYTKAIMDLQEVFRYIQPDLMIRLRVLNFSFRKGGKILWIME